MGEKPEQGSQAHEQIKNNISSSETVTEEPNHEDVVHKEIKETKKEKQSINRLEGKIDESNVKEFRYLLKRKTMIIYNPLMGFLKK